MEKVIVADVSRRTLLEGIEDVFACFGGVGRVIPTGSRVHIKPNAVHFSPGSYTDPAVLEALLGFLRDSGYRDITVMENATGGNFTRLVFHSIGYARLCKRYGAEAVYLDEGPEIEVVLPREEAPVRLPSRLVKDIAGRRDGHFYLSLPRLKTHSMTTVSMGVKNQQAFPSHADRMHNHSHATLHRRLASLYEWIRPDFCLVDGVVAVIHGHLPATALLEESTVPMGVLIGGSDTVAVDTVGARMLGYGSDEVEHLQLCGQRGLGQTDLEGIEVVGVPLTRFRERWPCRLLGRFHPDVQILEGNRMSCDEGCKGNSLCILEMLTNDYHGKGGWTLVFGEGIDTRALETGQGPVLVVGPCAVKEVKAALTQRPSHRKFHFVDACNDLMQNMKFQARLMGVKPLSMIPVHPLKALWLLLVSRIHGSKARIPPPFG